MVFCFSLYRNLLYAVIALSSWGLSAQSLPATQVFLFDFDLSHAPYNAQSLSAPRLLTAFNAGGYNNQPYFFSENKLYLSVRSASDTANGPDVVELDLSERIKTPVTHTRFPEYSPTLMPDGSHFSCIRVDDDGTQRLWAYPLDRSDGGRVLFDWLTGIGYHVWVDADRALLFIVGAAGKDHRLVLADKRTRATNLVATNPGRSLARTRIGSVAYVHKATEKTWFIKEFDPETGVSLPICLTLPESEDFCLLPDGSYLMGSGAVLHRLHPAGSKVWEPIADLSGYGIKKISRLALWPDGKLAMVTE